MQTIHISHLPKELHTTIDSAIHFEPVRINTKNGSAIIINEEEYKNLQETLHLCSIEDMKESILEGCKTPIEECIKEEDFKW